VSDDQERATCTSTTTTGARCRAYPRTGRDVCAFHDPDVDLNAARRRGGTNRATVVRLSRSLPSTLGDLVDLVVDAAQQAHDGRMPPAQARAVAACARAGAAIYADHAVEDRLDHIERHLAAIGRPLRSAS